MNHEKHIYRTLFLQSFYLSAFTFGGGYVIIPLMRKKFVEHLKWIDDTEMLNLTALAQSSPGAVAVNASFLLGYRLAGLPGALITVFGTVLPPLILLSVISLFYTAFRDNAIIKAVMKGMQAGVAAVIADVVFSLGHTIVKGKDAVSIVVMVLAFAAAYFLKVNVAYIILACGLIGAVKVVLQERKARREGGEH